MVADAGSTLESMIESSARPVEVRAVVDRLAERHPDLARRGEQDRAALVAVTAASRFLTRLIEQDDEALSSLGHLDHRSPVPGGEIDDLVRWKQREILRIAARDLLGIDDLEETTAGLSRLARDVLDAACRMADADGMAVIGMGKLGGNELNYSSDIDLMFVGDREPDQMERQARRVMELARSCFRVDANLRPEGRSGTLVRTIQSYETYWERWAQPWEFQALLKARCAAGDAELGEKFDAAAQQRLWNRPFGADELRSLRELKHRAEQELARTGRSDAEIKRGPGGIRDIEFTVQLLQLVHGQLDAALQSPNTLDVLTELGRAGYVADEDARELADAYRFLRQVEHRLQLVDDQQTHRLPMQEEARTDLARVLGYRSKPAESALEGFDRDQRKVRLAVRAIHQRVYFRPLLEAFVEAETELSPEAAEARLTAFGFTDAGRTKAAVRELTRGLNRASRLMRQLLPLMLDWLSTSPDPDLGLLTLRNLTVPPRSAQLVEAFRESPDVARVLCRVVGTSPRVGEILIHNPDLVARLPVAERLLTRRRTELVASATTASGWREQPAERQEALRRWKERHLVGIAARDIVHDETVETVGRDLTRLAEACVEVTLASERPGGLPFSVVAMGRFGGTSISYASDLDVVFVYEGDGSEVFEEADRLGRQMLRSINGPSPSDRIYEIDAQLRPEGAQGPMARTVQGFVAYFERWAQTWERLAYMRARPIAGDLELGWRLIESIEEHVWGSGLDAESTRELRRMKARVETERIPVGEDPRFHLKLGPGALTDIEWTAQLLQLRHGVRGTGTIEALEALDAAGHLEEPDTRTLIDSYVFLEQVRNRLYLVSASATDSLPTRPEQMTRLSRSLDTNPVELRDHYLRQTRRSRKLVEKLFYET